MHLERTRSSYKDKQYSSYRIARSVRKDGRVLKEILFPLGQISELQVNQIKLILRTMRSPNSVLVALDDIIPNESLDYLDVAVANKMWDNWNLDAAIAGGTDSELSTRMIARILTVNRCTNPCSHYSIPKWIRRTALPGMLGITTDKLNDDKIYYYGAQLNQQVLLG